MCAEHEVGRGKEAREHGGLVCEHATSPVGALVLVDDEVLEHEGAGGVDDQVARLREHGVALEQEARDDHRRAALDEAADVVERDETAARRSARARRCDEDDLEAVRGEAAGEAGGAQGGARGGVGVGLGAADGDDGRLRGPVTPGPGLVYVYRRLHR